MDDVIIRITKPSNGPIEIKKNRDVITAQRDNLTCRLSFLRPAEYEEYNMILHLSDDIHSYEPINLGKENIYDITSAYTRNKTLFVSLEMIGSTGERAHSNSVVFEIRKFSGGGDMPPNPVPPPINSIDKLYGGVQVNGDKLVMTNLNGEPLKTVTLPGTGGGTGGYDGSFTLDVEDGNLYFITDSGAANPFEYDEATGNLYYVEG